MENDKVQNSETQNTTPSSTEADSITTGLGIVAGGVIGATLGHAINKKLGTEIGGVVGAITGGIAANQVADFAEAVVKEVQPTIGMGLGADQKPIECPRHYSWEELQALSKPQGGQ
jgi:outer membrane lipoprotein SlyB